MQKLLLVCLLFAALAATALAAETEENGGRVGLWIDLYRGEPVTYQQMLADLAGVRVIYLGERHRLQRHHGLQAKIIADLAAREVPLVLGLEQMESVYQPQLDRFNKGQLDFDQLAKATNWPDHWHGYRQYRPLLEAAHKAGAPVLALNAKAGTIRQVFRSGGIEKLDPQLRKELPEEIQTDDPLYERLLKLHMMVHATATPKRLRPMIEAQIARDEAMAAALCSFLKSKAGRGRTAIVVCGAGHVVYGLGTAGRVRRRLPGLKQRVILLSESGDVELTPAERAMSRDINITHGQLRTIGRPVGDYLHATSLRPRGGE